MEKNNARKLKKEKFMKAYDTDMKTNNRKGAIS